MLQTLEKKAGKNTEWKLIQISYIKNQVIIRINDDKRMGVNTKGRKTEQVDKYTYLRTEWSNEQEIKQMTAMAK